MRAFLKSLLKLSYLSFATAAALFGLMVAGVFALTYSMGDSSCRKDTYNASRTSLCKGAAELGHPEASFFVATDYHFGNFGYEVDLERAKAEYLFAADRGVTKAQVNLGELLLSGELGEADAISGLSWLLKAAQADDPKALYRLARLLFNEERGNNPFTSSENTQAISLFKRAATQGHEPSQFALGLIYYFGITTEEDELLGIYWINEAYEAGYNPAAEFVEEFNKTASQGAAEVGGTLNNVTSNGTVVQ